MKKTLFLLACLSAGSVMAEDVLQVVPFRTTAGITNEDYEETFSLNLVCTNTYKAVQFDMYLPEGLTLDEEWAADVGELIPVVKKGNNHVAQHGCEVTDKGNGHYFVTVSPVLGATKDTFVEGDGTLMVFYYKTSSDMRPGIYPIRVEGTVLGIDGNNGVYPESSVSFVTITDENDETNPNSVLDLGNNLVPSFVESALPSQNVVKNGVCNNLVITDGNAFSATNTFTATNATYTRSVANDWGTVCLPYAVQSDANVQYYQLQNKSESTLVFTEVAALEAGQPGVFKKLGASTEVTMQGSSVNVVTDVTADATREGLTLVGTFSPTRVDVDAAPSYYIKDNTFMKGNEYFTVGAFRAWFESNGTGEAKARYSIAVEDASGIQSVVGTLDTKTGAIYSISGAKTSNTLQNGIYVKNGKKYLVK